MDKYRAIGPVYEFLCKSYGGTAFDRCRISLLETIKPGTLILFAGVGHGADAVFAARKGAKVTVVELSLAMLEQFRKNAEAAGLSEQIQTIHGPIEDFNEVNAFDVVVANFFLNVFDKGAMHRILFHLIGLVRPGGSIILGDFSYAGSDSFLAKIVKNTYWFLANGMFWALAKNPLHSIYNYPVVLRELGLKKLTIKFTKMLNINFFWSIQAIKPE